MTGYHVRCFTPSLVAGMLCFACLPARDLDETASGSRKSSGGTSGSSATGLPSESGHSGAGARDTGAGTKTGGSGGSETTGSGGLAPSRAGAGTGVGGTDGVGEASQDSGGTGATTGGSSALVGGASGSGGSVGTLGGNSPIGGATGTGIGGSSAASGGRAANGGTPGEGGRSGAGGALPTTGGASNAGSSSGGTAGFGGLPMSTGGAQSGAGGSSTVSGGSAGEGGTTGEGGATGYCASIPAGTDCIAPDLPDLPIPPVAGGISYSEGASWDIEGVQVPAYEIHTPTANYWLVKSAAALVEITDNAGRKWISFSSSYRPKRGVPNLGGCCQPGDPALLGMPQMTTVVDSQSVTLTHLRLVSKPVDGDYYWLVWDFYLTHVTITVNRAEEPFGFTYHGVPGGNLDPEDQLVLSTGESESALVGYADDLPGPVEWIYMTGPSPNANSALFLIQHDDDSLAESYGVADSNSAKFTFGGGKRTETPVRYSLGIVDSVAYSDVSDRVEYVLENTPSLK